MARGHGLSHGPTGHSWWARRPFLCSRVAWAHVPGPAGVSRSGCGPSCTAAWVRSDASSLATISCTCFLTVLMLTGRSRSFPGLVRPRTIGRKTAFSRNVHAPGGKTVTASERSPRRPQRPRRPVVIVEHGRDQDDLAGELLLYGTDGEVRIPTLHILHRGPEGRMVVGHNGTCPSGHELDRQPPLSVPEPQKTATDRRGRSLAPRCAPASTGAAGNLSARVVVNRGSRPGRFGVAPRKKTQGSSTKRRAGTPPRTRFWYAAIRPWPLGRRSRSRATQRKPKTPPRKPSSRSTGPWAASVPARRSGRGF